MQLYRDANFQGETYCLSLENDEFLIEDDLMMHGDRKDVVTL